MLHRYILSLLLVVASSLTGLAQSVGVLRGQVLDPSGAIVPGASITLTAGKNAFTTKSGADGSYSFLELPTGNYSLTVEADGFASMTRSNVAVAAGQTRQVDLLARPDPNRLARSHVKGEWQRIELGWAEYKCVSGRGLSGASSGPRLDATVPRRYNLTLVVVALNLFNIVNRGPENGVLNSTLFGQSQTLAGGPYGSPTPGNRSILLSANFSF